MIDLLKGSDFTYIQKINHEVADKLFPNRTDSSMFLKLYEEIGELVNSPGNADEIADVIIMLLDHASRHNVNAGHAVLIKLCTNVERKWAIDTRTGVAHHVERNSGEAPNQHLIGGDEC